MIVEKGKMTMKKKIALLLTGICTLALLTGCGQKQDANEYVTLGKYRKMDISVEKEEITEEHVKAYIENILNYYPTYNTLDKTIVENGDFVNIDFEGLKDGVAFEGGTAKDQVLEIGSNSFIKGFEEGLIGVTVGETVALDLTFPDPYERNPDLAGAAVVFNVKVNSIVEPEEVSYEALTDEYVVTNLSFMGYSSVQDMKDKILKELTASNESDAKSSVRQAILDKLLEVCPVKKLPEGELDKRVKEYKDSFASQCKEQYGMELAKFLETYYQTTEEEFTEQITSYMKENIELELILQAIADKESIEIDEEGYKEFIKNTLSYYQYESEEELYKANGEEYWKTTYLGNLVIDMLEKEANITYTKPATGKTEEGTAK